MIRNLQQEDITKVMTIWTKGNFTAHDFIEKDYWLENFNKVKKVSKDKFTPQYLFALFLLFLFLGKEEFRVNPLF